MNRGTAEQENRGQSQTRLARELADKCADWDSIPAADAPSLALGAKNFKAVPDAKLRAAGRADRCICLRKESHAAASGWRPQDWQGRLEPAVRAAAAEVQGGGCGGQRQPPTCGACS